jgi:hypothetical protein
MNNSTSQTRPLGSIAAALTGIVLALGGVSSVYAQGAAEEFNMTEESKNE